MAVKSKITSTHKKLAVIIICFGSSAYILINMFFIPKRVDPNAPGVASIEAMLVPPNLTVEQYKLRRQQYLDLMEKDKTEGKPENPMYARMIKALDDSPVGKEALAANGGAPSADKSKPTSPANAAKPQTATAATSDKTNTTAPATTPADAAAQTGTVPPAGDAPPTAAELAEKPTVELDIVNKSETVKDVSPAELEAAKIIEEAPTAKPDSDEITYVAKPKGWDHAWQLKLPIETVRKRDLVVVAVFKVNSEVAKTEVLFSSDKLSRSKADGLVDIAVNMSETVAKNDKNILTVSTAITVRDQEKDFVFKRGINIGNEKTMKLKHLLKDGSLSKKNQLFSFDNLKGNVELIIETHFRS